MHSAPRCRCREAPTTVTGAGMDELHAGSNDHILRILLVEDNPGDVRLTQEALKDLGHVNHLSVARDGEEALSFLRREGRHSSPPRPDLIMLDLNLPKKDG